MNLKGSQTEKNLLKTFAGESRARNKYTFYGETAEIEGYEFIASVFRETADNEKAHARRVFNDFLKMNKSTADNLADSAMGEAFESKKLYKNFERIAREEGFEEIAGFYKEIAEVEESHENRYTAILNNLKAGKIFRRDIPVKWQCRNCGYIHEGKEAPEVCPLCKFPRAYFQIYCENYK